MMLTQYVNGIIMQLSMRGMPMRAIRLLLKTTAIALLALTLSTNRFLPINYLIIIGVVEIGLLLLVWKRKVIQIFIVLLMMITSMGLMYAENIASRLIKYNPDQINTASFFTLKESKILTVKSLVKGTISIRIGNIYKKNLNLTDSKAL
jgi:hypothetical protein